MVHQVLMDKNSNRATGVVYVDRNTLERHEVHARVVILCAQSLESVRILLNSTDSGYAQGLANSSGVLGHYFMAHIRSAGGSGDFPGLGRKPTLNGPNPPSGLYIPRFRNLPGGPRSKTFLRGYGYEGGSSVDFNLGAAGFGESYKRAVLEPQVRLSVTGFGEVLPRWDNFIEIDPQVKDRYGIPVLRISMADGPNEAAMLKDIADSAGEMLEGAGARNVSTYLNPPRGRWAVHEAGTARMGSNPKSSVLNQYQQAHDVANLFVMDAAGFVSNPCQNPTLTIMALCVRSCDYLMGEMKRGNI
jgi:choline dehydrogenase-like flavoprotein